MESTDTQNEQPGVGTPDPLLPKPMNARRNPYAAGFKQSTGKSAQGKSARYITKKNLLKLMLEVDLTVSDLPLWLADKIREKCPGFLDAVERKFTMYQVMEMTQLQLLFSGSDYVRQDAINAIKDRTEGKPMQKIQVEKLETEPTEFKLPGGRLVII